MPPFDDQELEERQLLVSAAAEIYRMRRARDGVMPPGLTGEPAWDILLALYSEGTEEITISSLCHGAAVPSGSALRWVGVLHAQGLVEKTLHQRDERIVFVSLTDAGRSVVEHCLKAMLRSARG